MHVARGHGSVLHLLATVCYVMYFRFLDDTMFPHNGQAQATEHCVRSKRLTTRKHRVESKTVELNHRKIFVIKFCETVNVCLNDRFLRWTAQNANVNRTG